MKTRKHPLKTEATSPNMMRKSLAAALTVLSTGYAPLPAQTLELGALFGWYEPLARFHIGEVITTDLPYKAAQLRGISRGAEARVRLHGNLAIEAVFSTTTSTSPGCVCPGGQTLPPTGQRVSLVVVEGLYRKPLGGANEVSLGLGPAMIQHGGEGYGRYGSPKSLGGAGSIEVSRLLTSHLDASARALAAAYSFYLDYPPQSGPQLDLVISLSVRWRLRAASRRER